VLPPRVYHQVDVLAAQLSADLRWLHYGAQQFNRPALADQTQELPTLIDNVRRAAQRQVSRQEIGQAFARFDEAWHRVAHAMRSADIPSWMQGRVAGIADRDERLHRLLQIGQTPVYDRLRVAALAEYLQTPYEAELHRLAQRVHRQAQDLAGAVRRNASHAEIVDEHQRFKEAWVYMRKRAWTPSDVRPQFRDMLQVIRPIDLALHEELNVNSPVVLDRERLRAVAERIEEGADHLARDLEYDLKRDPRDLIDAARRLAYAADRVEQRLASTAAQAEVRRDMDYLLQTWAEFERRVPRDVNDKRFAHTLRVYEELKEDMRRLQTRSS
jgi:hypothetical protein